MSQYNVAIVGATGLVGESLISLLEDREFPISSLIPIASERSQNKHVQFKGENIKIQVLNDFNFTRLEDGIQDTIKWFKDYYNNCRK